MPTKERFTKEEASEVAKQLNLNWSTLPFDLEQFCQGMNVELEHGTVSPATNVTDDDPVMTGKIALAHLNEFADYYKRLAVLEKEADAFWGKNE